MKTKITAVLALVLILFCSCSVTDGTTLLSPPDATGEHAGIREAIEQWADTSISYKYPLGGEYRSAIILNDLNNDGKDEAVAFYKRADGDESIHIIMLSTVKGKWTVCNDIIGAGAGIDKVIFCDMTGENEKNVVVSWSLYNNTQKTVRIYSVYAGGTFIEVPTSYIDPETLESHDITYNDILYGDFDSDGSDELMTLVLTSAVNQTEASANMVEYYFNSDSNEPFATVTWSTPIDKSVISYSKIKVCSLSESTAAAETSHDTPTTALNAVVIDGVNAQNMTVTDVVCWDNTSGVFTAPFYNAETGLSTAFLRNSKVLSQDIDGDGLTELPSAVLMPSYSEQSTDALYMLVWNRYTSNTESHTIPILNTVHNLTDGYYIIVPDMWVGKITAKYDNSSTMYVYLYDESTGSFGSELFRIHVCTDEQYSQLSEQGFFSLAAVGSKVYCARIIEENLPDEGTTLSKEVLTSLFKLVE